MKRALTWLIALIIPFFLLTTAIRIAFSPPSIDLEYRMPGFPPDPFGFSQEERMHWARISLDYLYNDAGIEFLANQQLPDGSPLYNERELSHMEDVKVWFQQLLTVWVVLLLALAGLGLWAWRGRWLPAYLRGVGNGGRLTIVIILLILAVVAISFRELFTLFHRLFFEGDTWLFNFSDTLIRLFPLRLWQDAFIGVGVLTLLGALALILIERRWGKTTQPPAVQKTN